MRLTNRTPLALAVIAALLIAIGVESATSIQGVARAYYNLPLAFWPVDAEYRHVLNYPDTDWTWQFLGLNDGYRCPSYYRREREDSYDIWRTPGLPEDQDWLQASQGNTGVACYRDHEGTDIATLPLAPVYAVADGIVSTVEARADEKGEDGIITIAHSHEFRDKVYTWTARYIHLDTDFLVAAGGPVRAGQVIGYVANRGTNTHLHFEMRDLEPCLEGCIVNPWGTNADHTLLWIDYDDLNGLDVATEWMAPAPAGENLVYNGNFAHGSAGWSPWEGAQIEVKGGRLWATRRKGTIGLAAAQQVLPYGFDQGMTATITLRLGNTADVRKYVGVSLRGPLTWKGYVGCAFVLQPETPLTALTVRGAPGGEWRNAILAISVNPADGLPGVVVDDVRVVVTPDPAPGEVECEGMK